MNDATKTRVLQGIGAAALVVAIGYVAPQLSVHASFTALLPASLVVVAAAGYGVVALRALGAYRVLDRERWIWATITGLGVVGLVMQTLAHLGMFHARAAAVVVAVGVGVLAVHARAWWNELAPAPREPGALWLAAAVPFAVVVVAVAAAPPTFHDALVYHLGLPMQYAARSAAVVDVHFAQSAFPLLAEMAASPALLLASPEAFGFVYALEWLLLVVGVFVLARRTFVGAKLAPSAHNVSVADATGAGVGGACAFVVACMPMTTFLAAGTKPDLLAACFAVVVLRALARLAGNDGPSRVPLARLGALCLGLGVATKTTFLVWAVVVGVVVIALIIKRAALEARTVAESIALVVVAGAFPYVRNALVIGAPLYPFAGGPPWAEHMRDVLAGDAHRPHALVDVLATPWDLVTGANDPLSNEALGLVAFVGLAVLFVSRPRSRALVVFAALAVLTLPAWFLTQSLPRYNPFLWLVLGVAGGVGLAQAHARVRRGGAVVVVAALVASFVSLSWSVTAADALLRRPSTYLTQHDTRDEFLARSLDTAGAYAALNAIGRRGGNVCVLLATADPRIAYLQVPALLSESYARPVVDEIVSDAADADAAVARARASGVTHVVVASNALTQMRKRGWGQFPDDKLAAFVAKLGAPVYEDRMERVYAMDPAPPSSSSSSSSSSPSSSSSSSSSCALAGTP